MPKVILTSMHPFTKYTAVCCAALLGANCRKEEPAPVPEVVPAQLGSKASGASLSGLSRKQRQAHRILATVSYLEGALAVLKTLERKGQLVGVSGTHLDLAETASALARIREETERTEADEKQGFHGKGLSQVEAVLTQLIDFGNQTVPSAGSEESRQLAAALVSATDALESTSPLLESELRARAQGEP